MQHPFGKYDVGLCINGELLNGDVMCSHVYALEIQPVDLSCCWIAILVVESNAKHYRLALSHETLMNLDG